MAINKIQIGVVGYENTNRKSPSYGKYFFKVNPNKTLTTRGFLDHVNSHGLTIPASMMEATLLQVSTCLAELLLQGNPVKIDGFGTFMPTLECKGGVENVDDVGSSATMRSKIKGVHFRLIPDGTALDNTQSTKNLEKASVTFDGFVIGTKTGWGYNSMYGLANVDLFCDFKNLQ